MSTDPNARPLAGGDSIVRRKHFVGIFIYMMVSAMCAAPLSVLKNPPAIVQAVTTILFCIVLLVGFLIIARTILRRIAELDEFQRMIAWRALAKAGLLTVFVELVMAMAYEAGRILTSQESSPLFMLIAFGPVYFWIFAAACIYGAERSYASTPAT